MNVVPRSLTVTAAVASRSSLPAAAAAAASRSGCRPVMATAAGPAAAAAFQQAIHHITTAATSSYPGGGAFSAAHQRWNHQGRSLSSSAVQPTTGASSSSLAETTTSSDGVVGKPIDFDVSATIEGNESQIVTIDIRPGEVLRAESGAMMFMTNGIEMNTTTGGGLSSGFSRMLTGQNFFISDYTYTGDDEYGRVALGTDFPSKIVRLPVADYGGKLVCQKGALLCASHTIDIQMEFSKNFSTGFFGGEGFVLQGLTGQGDVFLKAGGTLIRRELQEGEVLRISSGCLVAFSSGVDYDVQMVKGFANVFAGGEGLFITTLTGGTEGPNVVWLQGQPPQRMISEIARRVPSGGGIGFGIPIGGGGGDGGEGGGDGSGET